MEDHFLLYQIRRLVLLKIDWKRFHSSHHSKIRSGWVLPSLECNAPFLVCVKYSELKDCSCTSKFDNVQVTSSTEYCLCSLRNIEGFGSTTVDDMQDGNTPVLVFWWRARARWRKKRRPRNLFKNLLFRKTSDNLIVMIWIIVGCTGPNECDCI